MSDKVILYLKRAALVVCVAVLIFAGYDQGKRTGYDEGYSAGYAEMQSKLQGIRQESYQYGYDAGVSAATPGPTFSDSETGEVIAGAATSPEQSVTVYVTDSGTKYHRWGCQYLWGSSNSISLEDAEARGYTPCSKCW